MILDKEILFVMRNVVMQTSSKKRGSISKSNSQSESSTPKGVVRKLLKPRRPCRPKSRSSKKTSVQCRDEDVDTAAAGGDAGTRVHDSKPRLSVGSVSSATKLKLAAFSANDSLVCRAVLCHFILSSVIVCYSQFCYI